MNQSAFAGGFQVSLTGRCLDASSEQERRDRLQQQFQLDAAQAARMLAGAGVIKRSLELPDAARLAGLFRRCGLEARVEAMPGSAVSTPPPAAAPRPTPAAVSASSLSALPRGSVPTALPLARPERLRLILTSAAVLLVALLYLGPVLALTLQWAASLALLHQSLAGWSLPTLVLSYLLLGGGGALLAMLLLKPLLAPRTRRVAVLRLGRGEEAEFVRELAALCTAIAVPVPAEIEFDAGTEARLGYRDLRGWWRDQRVLRLGLPLFAGLSARELVGVLTQALAHGAAPARLRSFALINAVNAWLDTRALSPDRWDAQLEQWHENSDRPVVQTATSLAALAIGFQQMLLGVLARLAQSLTAGLMRDLVAQADRYQAVVTGSRQFRATARNLRALAQAAEEVHEANERAWAEGRLLQDLPRAIGADFRAMDSERLQAIEAEMDLSLRRYWEPHPADLERVQAAEALAEPGLYRSDEAASSLLREAESWNRELTGLCYQAQGLDYRQDQLQPREVLLAPAAPRDAQAEALDRFFNGQFQPWPLLRLKLPADPALAKLGWQEAIDLLRQRSPEMTEDWAAAAELEQRRPRLLLASALKRKPSQFGLKDLDSLSPEELWRQLERIRNRATETHRHLQDGQARHALRIHCAVSALEGRERGRADALRALLVALQQQLEAPAAALLELRAAAETLQRIAAAGSHPEAAKDLGDVQRLFCDQAGRLLQAASKLPQRFTEGGSVGGFLLQRCPGAVPERRNDTAQYLRDGRELPEAFQEFYRVCLAELIALCEDAERRCGITPIRRL